MFLLLDKTSTVFQKLVTIAVFSSFGDRSLEDVTTELNIEQLKRVLLPSSQTTPNHRNDQPLQVDPEFKPPPQHSYLILQSCLMEISKKRKVRETKDVSTHVSIDELNRVIGLIPGVSQTGGGGLDEGLDDEDSQYEFVNMRMVKPFKMDVYRY